MRKTVEILALIMFYSHRGDRHQLIITKLKVKMFCTKRVANRIFLAGEVRVVVLKK